MEERRQRTDDKPTALAWEKFRRWRGPAPATAHPIIGWRDQLAQLQPQQARDWYDRFYVPGNATLVIAGDVTPGAGTSAGGKVLRDLPPRRNAAAARRPRSNPPPGERRMTLRLPVRVPALYMSYNVPSLTTARTIRTTSMP